MGYEQTAASRGYDPAQIERDWTMARAWLRRAMSVR